MADPTLIGQNYTTPDLVAKVTGRARYAEDYRADGMLFVKLCPSDIVAEYSGAVREQARPLKNVTPPG